MCHTLLVYAKWVSLGENIQTIISGAFMGKIFGNWFFVFDFNIEWLHS